MHNEDKHNKIALYVAPDGSMQINVRFEADTVWLTQRQMAELFDTTTDNVGLHLKNIYESDEFTEAATTEDYSVVQQEGRRRVRRDLKHYNLDAIIGVGYRVNSKRGTQFRIWATNTLREHLVKGFTVNEARLRKRGLTEVEEAVRLLGRTLNVHGLITDEGQALLDLILSKHLAERPSIPMSRRERRICSISSSKTIHSTTEISGSAAYCFCITSTKTKG